jgi:hypothetical protein
VSYVWTHAQSTDGIEIPEYRIWDGADLNKPPSALRCPPIVFHRAVQFAQHKSIRRIWIDQECIDQEDTHDIESHLQDMHRIYRLSRSTVAVLSTVMSDLMLNRYSYDGNYAMRLGSADLETKHMTKDPWFTRSW